MESSLAYRCEWASSDSLMAAYHDTEWGTPSHDDAHLFEMLILEGAQAGLSWQTILRKREGYRRAFADFDIPTLAGYDEKDVARLVTDSGIVRHRGKIEAAISNARAALRVRDEFGSLSAYLWGFVNGKPVRNAWTSLSQVPPTSDVSDRMSRDLKRRGFRFVGSTTCYAFMQASGMVNDHLVGCFRYAEV